MSKPALPTSEQALFDAAHQYLVDRGHNPAALPREITIRAELPGGHEFFVAAGDLSSSAATSPRMRRPLRQRILESIGAAGKPLKAGAVARRLGHNNDSYLRGLLSTMVHAGLLDATEEGYTSVTRHSLTARTNTSEVPDA